MYTALKEKSKLERVLQMPGRVPFKQEVSTKPNKARLSPPNIESYTFT